MAETNDLRVNYPIHVGWVGTDRIDIGVVTETVMFNDQVTVQLDEFDEEGQLIQTYHDATAIFTAQTEWWIRTKYHIDKSYRVREFMSHAYCIDDTVILYRRYSADLEAYENFVLGHYEGSAGYPQRKLPYLWPVFKSPIICGFSGTGFPDGTDFPFYTDETTANETPIASFTDALGLTRAAGSSTVTSPWGVLTYVDGDYIFHRQYEFCKGDSRIALEPYDESIVYRSADLEVGANQDGTKILLCGVPIAEVQDDPPTSIESVNILDLNPLTISTLISQEGYSRNATNSIEYHQLGAVTVYIFEDVCWRDFVMGNVSPLPLIPDEAETTLTVPLIWTVHHSGSSWSGYPSRPIQDPGLPPFEGRFEVALRGYSSWGWVREDITSSYFSNVAKLIWTWNRTTQEFDFNYVLYNPRLALGEEV